MRIYLDFDGPLVQNRAKYGALYAEGMAAQHVAPLEVDRYWDLKRHRIPDAEICALTSPLVRAEEYLRFRDAWIEDPRFVARDVPTPGALDLLRAWRAAGHSLRLATMRKRHDVLERQLDDLGLTDLLDAVLCVPGNDGAWAHKARLIAEDRAEMDEAALLIGDTEGDILAARAAGIPVVAVCDGLRAEALLRLFAPDALVPTITAVRLDALVR